MKKIVIITTGQPSCNPRIVKEADALCSEGYEVTVLYNYFIAWAEEKDKVLLAKVTWSYYLAAGSPFRDKKRYLFSRIRNKLAAILSLIFGNKFLLAERTQARTYDELLREAKKIKADWYIGHNLGALAVAVKAARFHGAKAGFDFEDYYRGENTTAEIKTFRRISYLENKYLPWLSYFSTASHLITEALQKDHPGFKGAVITLNNCFPLKQQPLFTEKKYDDNTLQLFWFSQTIGINRGLEVLIDAMTDLKDPDIHLTLAGRCNKDMQAYISTHAGALISNIHFAGIIQPELLPAFASQFDVGLALETGFSENNNIALSNKIFTYLLAGNAIILSETAMQLAFNETYKVGEGFKVNSRKELAHKIKLYKDINKLNAQKNLNYELAKQQLNWEEESKKIIATIANYGSYDK